MEDSVVTAQVEIRYLGDAGHTCGVAATGQQALEMIQNRRPDLVLLDYMLPDLNGLEVMRRILALAPEVLVIMVTGQGWEELAAEVMRAGARDYVVKTHKFFEPLVHVVERVLKEDRIRKELQEKARLNERLEAQNELTYWVAHNFRNLFSGAIGFLQLIDFHQPDQPLDKRLRYQRNALTSLNRATKLVDQLLFLTEVAERPPDSVVLCEMVTHAAANVRNILDAGETRAPDFELENNTGHLPPLRLGSRDMRLVLENLLMNAVEALDSQGRVTVRANIQADSILILQVTDNGRGMDDSTRRRAMEPLFSTKGTVGVGLGLSLVQAALKRQNAQIHLQSAPAQGTTVTITWPLKIESMAR